MPEGPEVFIIANQLNTFFKDNVIENVEIIGGRYQNHGPPKDWDTFTQKLPLRVSGVYSKGKFIWFEFAG